MQLTELAHDYLTKHLHHGDLAIDATAGNGHDTLKMAELVGPDGRVVAIDIQASAISATSLRLSDADQLARCELIEGDHANTLEGLANEHSNQAAAITFNLGYLPGSDKSIQTTPASTLTALDAAARLLKSGGILLVTAYRGHEGGLAESESVAQWMHVKEAQGWEVESHEPKANRIPPILWVLKK
jgi:ubiquinone/menaquinone biosynthesis C-methylase UbiE